MYAHTRTFMTYIHCFTEESQMHRRRSLWALPRRYVCVHVYMRACECIRLCMYVCMCFSVCIHIHTLGTMDSCTLATKYACMCIRGHNRLCMHVYVCICTYVTHHGLLRVSEGLCVCVCVCTQGSMFAYVHT